MAETTLESVRRQLDQEQSSAELLQLSQDFYLRVADHVRNLKRSSGAGSSEVTNRLISRQIKVISSLIDSLVRLRLSKTRSRGSTVKLLSEERFILSPEREFITRLSSFVEAVTQGHPSFVEYAVRMEAKRKTTIRFTRPVAEIMGGDMRRYGPFKPNDVASLPSASAEILITNNEAIEIDDRGY
ncbi:MAG TPA: hypothetical protein VEJ36_02135 [Nitrososphaerales archaeon]|nr:hypothetical protein [Nitrososphaerales archaeon]